jgi:hypothetical protein
MPVDRLPQPTIKDDPPLTGWVHGKEATDIEERFARALDNIGYEFQFQVYVPTPFTLPAEEKEIDFLVEDIMRPVEVDGEMSHKTASQIAKDVVRDGQLNPVLERWGYSDIKRITWKELDNQELADLAAEELT